MARQNQEASELEDRLADAQAQIESLQATAADAEARAATAREEIKSARNAEEDLRQQVAQAEAARDSSSAELTVLQAEASGARAALREAAVKYRDAWLQSAPEVPPEMVADAESLEDIDREIESARRLVAQVREKLQQETAEGRGRRVPPGPSQRRAADLASLSSSEKIRLGLQQLSEREGR